MRVIIFVLGISIVLGLVTGFEAWADVRINGSRVYYWEDVTPFETRRFYAVVEDERDGWIKYRYAGLWPHSKTMKAKCFHEIYSLKYIPER